MARKKKRRRGASELGELSTGSITVLTLGGLALVGVIAWAAVAASAAGSMSSGGPYGPPGGWGPVVQ